MNSSEMEPDGYSSLAELCGGNVNSMVATTAALLNSPVTEGKTILIVEGSDDEAVYSRFFNPNTVEIFPDGCCKTHESILSALNNRYFNRLAAIKDADFDHLTGRVPKFSNLFLTDERDLENMILKDGIPASVVKSFPDRCSSIVLSDIHHDIRMISYLRWMNDMSSLKLHFDALHLCEYYKAPYVVDMEHYLSDLNAASKNASTVSATDLFRFCEAHPVNEMSQLTQGHDLLECLFIRARSALRGNFSKSKFFAAIRESYSLEMFSRTRLCASFRSFRGCMLAPSLSA